MPQDITDLNNYTTSLNVVDGLADPARQNDLIRSLASLYEAFNKQTILDEGSVINHRISVSETSNNLTIAMRGADGFNPSPLDEDDPATTPGNPVVFRDQALTSALEVVMNASTTNWFGCGDGETDGKIVQLFVYLIKNSTSGVIDMGVSRLPANRFFSSFSASPTSYAYMKTTNDGLRPASTDRCILCGRIDAKLTFNTPNYEWQDLVSSWNILNQQINETEWLEWSPDHSIGLTLITPSSEIAKYKIVSDTVYLNCWVEGTTTGTTSIDIRIPLFLLSTESQNSYAGSTDDNWGANRGASIWGDTSTVFVKKYDGSNWGIGANRGFQFSGFYKVW